MNGRGSGARAARAAAAAGAVACLTAAAGAQGAPPGAVAGARQLVVVAASGWDDTTATLRRYARAARGAWRPVGAPVAVTLGRSGLAWGVGQGAAPNGAPVKREGDGRSPAGAYPLLHGFGFAADPAAPAAPPAAVPYLALTPATVCVDDPASPAYNGVVEGDSAGGGRWASAERMRAVAGYRTGVVVGYNGAWTRAGALRARTPNGGRPAPGRGSCIFLHVWDGPGRPTAGCTAMDAAAMREVLAWLDPAARPMIVQLPSAALAARRRAWALPPA